ncbi:MAG: preprotein translocase subunit YajC [Hydrotalea sp.]|nr:preprotein translocase subunit YajC [Hydrotalea sp.]
MKKIITTLLTLPLLSLAMANVAVAQAAAPGDLSSAMLQLFPLVLIFGVFWFLLIRPQMKKQKQHQALVAAVKKGDEVVLSSGVYGKITQVVDAVKVEVEIAPGVKVKAAKAMLADVLTKPVATAAKADDKPSLKSLFGAKKK